MTDTTLPVPIESKHGDGCTCTEVGRIDLTFVAADRDCPGDRNPHRGAQITAKLDEARPADYPGRGIVITWPPTNGNGMPLSPWLMSIHDCDTREQLLNVTGLRIVLGGDNWDDSAIYADLTMLVDEDGAPVGNGKPVAIGENDRPRTGVFRCYVAEMCIRYWPPADRLAA